MKVCTIVFLLSFNVLLGQDIVQYKDYAVLNNKDTINRLVNGKPHGEWLFFEWTNKYSSYTNHSPIKFEPKTYKYGDYQLITKGEYENGIKSDTWNSYKNGKLTLTYSYSNGILNGPGFKYNKHGDKVAEFNFNNGILDFYKTVGRVKKRYRIGVGSNIPNN